MPDHSELLGKYLQLRQVRYRLNNLIVKTISRTTIEVCARNLGFFRGRSVEFHSEDESAILADYCLYYPQSDGRSLVAKFAEKSAAPIGSEERVALQEMERAYYSLFKVLEREPGVGVKVLDLLRNEEGFIVDVGFGTTANPGIIIATRVIPMLDFLTAGGAAIPLGPLFTKRVFDELKRSPFDPESFDHRKITPQQEAEFAALVIRIGRSGGMTSRIAYAEPGAITRPALTDSKDRRIGRNDPCPCGSGKKYKTCCIRSTF